jgi:cytochrome c
MTDTPESLTARIARAIKGFLSQETDFPRLSDAEAYDLAEHIVAAVPLQLAQNEKPEEE